MIKAFVKIVELVCTTKLIKKKKKKEKNEEEEEEIIAVEIKRAAMLTRSLHEPKGKVISRSVPARWSC